VPKLTLAGTIEIWGWVPTPLSEIESGEFAAVLTTDALPVALPATVGVNVTLKLAACPADNVTIGAEPLRVKPLPVTLTCAMLTAELPVFVSVTLCMALALRVWLPKLKEVVLGVSCRTCAEPVPLSGIAVGEVGALLTSIRLPAELAPDVGVKLTVKAVDFPGPNASGKARPLRLNPVPGPVSCVMLRLAPPALVRVTVCELVWPTVTVPKLTLAGATEICG
jgi:hypothetical protein